jgi:hypothetical protein
MAEVNAFPVAGLAATAGAAVLGPVVGSYTDASNRSSPALTKKARLDAFFRPARCSPAPASSAQQQP